MRQSISIMMKGISNRSLICWVTIVSFHIFSHLHRAIRASANSIAQGLNSSNERNQKHDDADDFGMWLKIKPKQDRCHKNDRGSFHAIQIWTRIPFCREFGNFLVSFGAPCFFSLYHFLEHNRHLTAQPNLLQH